MANTNKGENKGHANLKPAKKGEVRNPTGRPKIPDDLKARAKDLCPRVLQTWEDIMISGQKDSDRIKASENIYFLAYGKFVQQVDAEIKAEVNVVSIGVPDFALTQDQDDAD